MFRKIEKSVSMFVEHVGMVLLVLMVLVVCFTVVTRYFFSYTPRWGEETALLCMVWFGFLSMALGVRDDLHLSITILDPLVPKFAQKPISLFKYVCTGGFGVFMALQGWRMVQVGLMNRFPGLGLTSAWLYAAVPIAGVAIFVYSLEKFWDILTGKRRPEMVKGGDA
ncbi:TRAP transporter small permease [Synergistaceae bacterium OttesenSCG-928-I11]|nr:TRAP transporter small permease [Synergistaceae bacterium OttesenSCG-928-I11]